MKKRSLIAIVILLACLAVAKAYERYQRTLVDDSMIDPHRTVPGDDLKTWSFQVPRDLAAREGVALVVRHKASPLVTGNPHLPIVNVEPVALPANDADGEFGTSILVRGNDSNHPASGVVSFQLLDLTSAGVKSADRLHDWRAIANLQIGGTTTYFRSDASTLPLGELAGSSCVTGSRWANNELYLMRFHVRHADALVRYDVLLQRKALAP